MSNTHIEEAETIIYEMGCWWKHHEQGERGKEVLAHALERRDQKHQREVEALREAMQSIDLSTVPKSDDDMTTIGDRMLDMKYAMLRAFDTTRSAQLEKKKNV